MGLQLLVQVAVLTEAAVLPVLRHLVLLLSRLSLKLLLIRLGLMLLLRLLLSLPGLQGAAPSLVELGLLLRQRQQGQPADLQNLNSGTHERSRASCSVVPSTQHVQGL